MKVWALVQHGEEFIGDGDVRAVVTEESVAHDWEARGGGNRAVLFELDALPRGFRRSAISE